MDEAPKSLGILLAFFARDYSNPPARSLLIRLLGERAAFLVGFLIGATLAAAGVLWLWNTLRQAWQERKIASRAFLFLTLLALVAAPAKVSHLFSSRYVVGLLGVLFLVVFVRGIRPGWLAARMISGSLIGAATLWTYYH